MNHPRIDKTGTWKPSSIVIEDEAYKLILIGTDTVKIYKDLVLGAYYVTFKIRQAREESKSQ